MPSMQIKSFKFVIRIINYKAFISVASYVALYIWIYNIIDELILNELIESNRPNDNVILSTIVYQKFYKCNILISSYILFYSFIKEINNGDSIDDTISHNNSSLRNFIVELFSKKVKAEEPINNSELFSDTSRIGLKKFKLWTISDNGSYIDSNKIQMRSPISHNGLIRSKSLGKKEETSELHEEIEDRKLLERKPSDVTSIISPWIRLTNQENEERTLLELKISERMKNILFWSISHELRSPINHINGMLELIKLGTKDENLMRFVKISISSWNMLKSKIDDILDYSMLETNSWKITKEPFDIRNMMTEIEDMMALQYDPSNITFRVFVSDSIPDIIYHDEKRLKQILVNLIFNAIKFTEKGFVVVVVDCYSL